MADDYPRKLGGFFDPNIFGSLQPRADYARQAIPTEKRVSLADLLGGLDTSPTRNALADHRGLGSRNALLDALNPPAKTPTTGLGALYAYEPPSKPTGLFGLAGLAPAPSLPTRALPVAPAQVKRKGFFSFHFDDIMRVNNVRNAWLIKHPDREFKRNFYDRSLWESKKAQSDAALKALIQKGMEHSSAVCVLVGTHTWERPWVRYEIARAVVDNRGLLAVHINGITHHQRRCADAYGWNPLNFMGVYKNANGKLYLAELRYGVNAFTGQAGWQWFPYDKYTLPVDLPRYLNEPQIGQAVALSTGAHEYDYCAPNPDLGAWIDAAAKAVGR